MYVFALVRGLDCSVEFRIRTSTGLMALNSAKRFQNGGRGNRTTVEGPRILSTYLDQHLFTKKECGKWNDFLCEISRDQPK